MPQEHRPIGCTSRRLVTALGYPILCREPVQEILPKLRTFFPTHVVSRRTQKRLLSEMAKFRLPTPHTAAAPRPNVEQSPTPGTARISPMASHVAGRLPTERECPPARSRPFALAPVFPQRHAVPLRSDFYLAMTATARPPLPVRPLNLAHLLVQFRAKRRHARAALPRKQYLLEMTAL